jgi:phosphoribosylformylglycinamidine synthase
MWQFSQAIEGMRDACLALEVPVVSGNVSFYNETDGIPIFPTPTIAMVGLLPAVEKHVTPWFKAAGDVIVLLGRTLEEIGGSEYLKVAQGMVKGPPPSIDLKLEKAVQRCCVRAIRRGLLQSAHDVSDGGLAVALAESCVGGPEKPLGAVVRLDRGMRPDALLFGESQSRIVVSVKKKNLRQLKDLAGKTGAPLEVIGDVGGSSLNIRGLLSVPVKELRSIWYNGLKRRLA